MEMLFNGIWAILAARPVLKDCAYTLSTQCRIAEHKSRILSLSKPFAHTFADSGSHPCLTWLNTHELPRSLEKELILISMFSLLFGFALNINF